MRDHDHFVDAFRYAFIVEEENKKRRSWLVSLKWYQRLWIKIKEFFGVITPTPTPKTMTELRMRIAEKEKERLLTWLITDQEVIGQEIRVNISQWNAGELGTFVCEIKKWEPKVEVA